VVLLGGADQAGSDTATGVNWLKIAIGVLFLGLAAKQWKTRPKKREPSETPGWLASIDAMTAPQAALLGIALSSINPKNLALVVTAAASIAQAGLETPPTAIAVAAFVILGSITVAGSVLFYVVDADRAARPLAAIQRLMSDNNAVIMMVILLRLGAKFIGDGVGALST
jgi:threonine/homoserine/homoserine lactone efflux protein